MGSLHFSFPEILYLFGAFHGLILSSYLVINKHRLRANIYLALIVCLFSFYLFENALFSSGYIKLFPHLLYASLPLLYLLAPLFFLYSQNLIHPERKLKASDLLHLTPFLSELCILVPVYVQPSAIKLQIYERTVNSELSFQFSIYFVGYLIYILSSLLYLFLSYRLIKRGGKESSQSKFRLKWSRQSSLVYFIYIVISLFLSLASFRWHEAAQLAYHTNLILQMVLIQLLGYVSFVNPEVFTFPNNKKYAQSSLNMETINQYKDKLIQLMEKDMFYMKTEITLEDLATKMGIARHHLSEVITSGLDTNFYDFINKYRVEKVKELMQHSGYSNAKLLHIAFDCGFSNKSTFIRSFKKNTGLTPSEFRKKRTNQGAYN